MMHTAHAVAEDDITVGAGFSGTVAVSPPDTATVPDAVMDSGAFAPGIAPWVGARYGLGNDFDAGLMYTGRAARLDGRRAFVFGDKEQAAVSLGIGLSGLLPARDDDFASRVGGFGADIPVLIGWRSTADIYAIWAGARGGIEILRGQRELPEDPNDPSAPLLSEDIDGVHGHVGGVLGLRVGFRYIFAVLELGGRMHWANGSVGDVDVAISQFALAPAGAIVGRF